MDHLSGGERESARGEGRHGTADIVRSSPATDRREARGDPLAYRRRGPAGSCRSRSTRDGSRRRGSPAPPAGPRRAGPPCSARPWRRSIRGRFTLAKVLEIEVMKTICGSAITPPDLSSIMARATAWVRKKGPRRLVPRTRSQLSAVVSSRSTRRSGATPALLTQRSTRPNWSSVCSSSRRPSVRSATSAWIARAQASTSVLGHAARRSRPTRDRNGN